MNGRRTWPWPRALAAALVLGAVATVLVSPTSADATATKRATTASDVSPSSIDATDSSSARTLAARLKSVLDALRREYDFPGATAAVAGTDGRVASVATGWADVERRIPMTPRSRMLGASVGKTFVAAAALSLEREGRLDLDDPVKRWLGTERWWTRLPNHETMTVRDLLRHTAGIGDHVHEPAFERVFSAMLAEPAAEVPSLTRLIELVLDRPPLFAPGAGWSYSDTGYLLLGLVIERGSGRRYEALVRERFLEPLGLESTTPSDRPDLPALAAGYVDTDNAFGLPARTTDERGTLCWNPAIEWTGGGWITTSGDLARWGRALFGGEAMAGDYLAELLRSVPIGEEADGVRYGAGTAIHVKGPNGTSYGHGGWIPGYVSSLRYYPDGGVAVAFQINTDVGIVDDSTDLVDAMERRLAAAALGVGG